MRVLFWFCEHFAWKPSMKTLDTADEAEADSWEGTAAAFVHVESKDVEEGSGSETKLVKNAKWLARKWEVKRIVLHSFAHLGEEKGDPEKARDLLNRAQDRLENAGYDVKQTPYGYFFDIEIKAPGKPLARIYKEW